MSRKGDALRSQAVGLILGALGKGQVNLYVRSEGDMGERSAMVTLEDRDTVFSDSFWVERDGTTTRIRLRVTVELVEETVK